MFLVHYISDDRFGTTGTCRTDHPLEKGEVIYAQHGRATVRACHHVTPVETKALPSKLGVSTARK